jgi:hypothetical protein
MDTQLQWSEDRAVYEVAQTETHLVDICPMIYNHRVVLTPKDALDCYDVGWCYPDLWAAVMAVERWDPASQSEPAGYIKRIG